MLKVSIIQFWFRSDVFWDAILHTYYPLPRTRLKSTQTWLYLAFMWGRRERKAGCSISIGILEFSLHEKMDVASGKCTFSLSLPTLAAKRPKPLNP